MRREMVSEMRRLGPDNRIPKFGVYDIEAPGFVNKLACGFFDGEHYFCFKGKHCVEDFVSLVNANRYRGYKIYAHNGGKYDCNFVIEALHSLGMHADIIASGSRIIQIEIKKGDGRIRFNDSYALMPMSLARLTRSFRVKHVKLEIDYDDMTKGDAWIPYLENDVIGLYECLELFRRSFLPWKVGLKMTIAQQAFTTFQRGLGFRVPTYENLEWFFRLGLHGGRAEVFKRYGENLNMYDFNSLYPSVMRDNDMPVGVPAEFRGKPHDKIGFAYCTVRAPEGLHIPLLPYGDAKSGKLIFPIGKFSGVWGLDELRKAEEIGYEVKYRHGFEFGQVPLFRDFISKFSSLREANLDNPVLSYIYKLVMNSTFGKTCESRLKEAIELFPAYTDGYTPINEALGIYSKPSYSRSSHILPAIGAHITELGRLKLYDIMEKAGLHNVLYVDTDSILTNAKFPTGKRLGELKLEYAVERAYCISPKFYFIKAIMNDGIEKDIVKLKGFPNASKFTEDDFKRALKNDFSKFSYSEKVFGSVKENIKRKNCFVAMVDKQKSIKSFYDKRVICRNRVDTMPLIINAVKESCRAVHNSDIDA